MEEQKRLFVRGLFSGVSEASLTERFTKFGSVEAVDIKVKKQEDKTETYAFVTIKITPQNLAKCFSAYSNTKWKGSVLRLEVAKESFLSRLQKEREGQANNNSAFSSNFVPLKPRNSSKPETPISDPSNHKSRSKRIQDETGPVVKNIAKPVSESPKRVSGPSRSSSSSSSSDSEAESAKRGVKKFAGLNAPGIRSSPTQNGRLGAAERSSENGSAAKMDVVDSGFSLLAKLENFSEVWNDDDITGSESRINRRDHQTDDWRTTPRPSEQDKNASNQKRLESIHKKCAADEMKQRHIKDALRSIDAGCSINTKIVFDDGETFGEKTVTKGLSCSSEKVAKASATHSAGGKKLFDDDSADDEADENGDDAEEMFRFRPQYEGAAGQKLIELQSHYGNDERFKIDERFVDNDDGDENVEHEEKTTYSDGINEARQNLSILEDVLGHKLVNRAEFKDKSMNTFAWKHQRYDPTKSSAVELEIPKSLDVVEQEGPRKKKKEEPKEEVAVPEVSQERFYEVASSLKDKFSKTKTEQQQPFSLLKSFGSVAATADSDENEGEQVADLPKSEPRSVWDSNPFIYDSSSDEEVDDDRQIQPENSGGVDSEKSEQAARSTFFFSESDSRLSEGIQFFKRDEDMTAVEQKWWESRKYVLGIFRQHRKRLQHKKEELEHAKRKPKFPRNLPATKKRRRQ